MAAAPIWLIRFHSDIPMFAAPLFFRFGMLAVLACRLAAAEPAPFFLLSWGAPGTGPGQFNLPTGLALAPSGKVYVADRDNHRIQVFDSDGRYLFAWGANHLLSPVAVAIDPDGSVFVCDREADTIYKFDPSGNYLTQWGSQGSGPGQFLNPLGLDVDPAGNVYVADSDNNRIQKFTNTGTYISDFGEPGTGPGQFSGPRDINASGSVLYVADWGNSRIQKFDFNGTFLLEWGSWGSAAGQFNHPEGVATDRFGSVYVFDSRNYRIQKFDSDGNFLTKWGTYGSAPGQFNTTTDGAIDATGNIYVPDWKNNRVQKFGLCTVSVNASYSGGVLTTNFVLGLAEPSTWTAWLDQGTSRFLLWSKSLPRIATPVQFEPTIPLALPAGDASISTQIDLAPWGTICTAATAVVR